VVLELVLVLVFILLLLLVLLLSLFNVCLSIGCGDFGIFKSKPLNTVVIVF